MALAFLLGAILPGWPNLVGAMFVGFLAYGVSLALFVISLRHLGTARTGAYFSIAPFFGAVLSVAIMGEPITVPLLAAGGLMALGIWLHLTERHMHEHMHEVMEHEHEHIHDTHHQHSHDVPLDPAAKHRHIHQHEQQTHAHAHFPDAHHRHDH